MKARRNIIMCSCVFSYFAGLWIIASRFGFIKLLTRYGISEVFDQIPKDFPNMKYLYYGLGIYTVAFVIITYIIYKVTLQADKEQETLQQQVSETMNYAEKIRVLTAAYLRQAKTTDITDKAAEQKLKMIQRLVDSLPPAIIRNPSMKSNLSSIITELQDQLSPGFDYALFCTTLDTAIDTINSLKRKTVTIN